MNETTPRQERRQRRQAENREIILHAAETVIIRRGLSATTMDDIAREADFSKATVYKHFPAKGDLVFAILIHFFEDIDRSLTGILASRDDPSEKLRQILRAILEWHEQKDSIGQMIMLDTSMFKMMRLFILSEAKPEGGMEQKVLSQTKAEMQKFQDKLGALLSEGVRSGAFRPVRVPEFTMLLTAAVQGFGHEKLWTGKHRPPAECADIIHDFFLRGIGAPSKRAGKE
jgi:AcrR family transcriptional regulator